MRKLAVVLACPLLMLVAFATPAQAANHTTVTEIYNSHGVFTEPAFMANPCTGSAIRSFDAFANVVSHITYYFVDGQITKVWAGVTETGKVTITDSAGITYTGHFTFWTNFILNERNTIDSSTLTVKLTGSDGSTIFAHETQHFALNANGAVTVDFDKMILTCG